MIVVFPFYIFTLMKAGREELSRSSLQFTQFIDKDGNTQALDQGIELRIIICRNSRFAEHDE